MTFIEVKKTFDLEMVTKMSFYQRHNQ